MKNISKEAPQNLRLIAETHTKKKEKEKITKATVRAWRFAQQGTEFITGQLGGVLVQAIGFNNVTRLEENDVIGSDVKPQN